MHYELAEVEVACLYLERRLSWDEWQSYRTFVELRLEEDVNVGDNTEYPRPVSLIVMEVITFTFAGVVAGVLYTGLTAILIAWM